MKTYEVHLFILGCDPKLTEEIVFIDADSQEEAEKIAHERYFSKGYGILSSKEYIYDLAENILNDFNEKYPNGDSYDLVNFVISEITNNHEI